MKKIVQFWKKVKQLTLPQIALASHALMLGYLYWHFHLPARVLAYESTWALVIGMGFVSLTAFVANMNESSYWESYYTVVKTLGIFALAIKCIALLSASPHLLLWAFTILAGCIYAPVLFGVAKEAQIASQIQKFTEMSPQVQRYVLANIERFRYHEKSYLFFGQDDRAEIPDTEVIEMLHNVLGSNPHQRIQACTPYQKDIVLHTLMHVDMFYKELRTLLQLDSYLSLTYPATVSHPQKVHTALTKHKERIHAFLSKWNVHPKEFSARTA
jgi:hypothetical protein